MSWKKSITLFLTIFLISVGICYAIDQFLLPTHGVFQGEYGLTFNPTEIDWGNVTLDTPVIRSVQLTNTGTKDFWNLTASYGNETTNLINYTLFWDVSMNSDYLLIGESILANFTLVIYNATSGPFQFDIYIEEYKG